jgi:chemotaxis protein histidine kinase CheA
MKNMDWDSDPELRALRDDFTDSFVRRYSDLALLLERARQAGGQSVSEEVLSETRLIAHNLGGIAVTYGFERIGKIATALDDCLSSENAKVSVEQYLKFAALLESAMQESAKTRQDVVESSAQNQRLKELTSFVESLASSSKP